MPHIKDIIGYKNEVSKLLSICDFLKNTEKYIKFGVELPNCLLITGGSGVGKTLFAKALIEDSERCLFNFDGNAYDYKKLKQIFKKAKKSAKSVVLLDDFDCLTNKDDCSAYFQLAEELDSCNNGEIFVIATAEDKKFLPDYLLTYFPT